MTEQYNLDPPNPIPAHLWPQGLPLGPGDLRIAPSTGELRVIARLLGRYRIAGQMLVTMRDGSPWLEVDVVVPDFARARDHVRPELEGRELASPGVYRFAIWRYTGRAYRVGLDGAVEDDPIEL